MFVIPVNPALSVDSEQSSYKKRSNPAFGMQLTRETKLFLKKARELARENPDSNFNDRLARLCAVIYDLTSKGRRGDDLRLEIVNPLWDGLQPFTAGAQVKLEAVSRKIGDTALHVKRTIKEVGDVLEGRTIIDEALELLADEKLRAKPAILLHETIIKAQEGLSTGIENVRVAVAPLRRRIASFGAPEKQAS